MRETRILTGGPIIRTNPHGKGSTPPSEGSSNSQASGRPEDLSEVMDFSSYDLRTTLRLVVLSGESRRVDVKRGSRQGSVYIREGEIYRAVAGPIEGDEAFFEILSWDRAVHRDTQESETLSRNVRVSTDVLLHLIKDQTSTTD